MSEHLKIVVVSDDGWSWLLAWMQIGVRMVECIPVGDKANSQLTKLELTKIFGQRIKRIENSDELGQSNKLIIVCFHITKPQILTTPHVFPFVTKSRWTPRYELIVSCKSPKLLEASLTTICPNLRPFQTIRHSALGGLTTARMSIAHSQGISGINLHKSKPLKRPLHRFLEPAAKFERWRSAGHSCSDCWRPFEMDATPYPWPWSSGPEWVETHSVFFKGMIQRQFTTKERCQLLDLRYEWKSLIPELLEWQDGATFPLRMYIEFITAARGSLRRIIPEIEENREETNKGYQIDWGRVRAPWVGMNEIDQQIRPTEKLKYFGWNWDSSDLIDISKACRGDDAEVNLDLWAVGGSSVDMEKARSSLRLFLWRCWSRRLTREATTWLRTNNTRENSIAIRDCIKRTAESDWWSWEAGSRLFFWRWPQIWREEAQNGSPGFHLKQPRPRLRFPAVPILEEWVKQKDKEKLEKLLRRGYIIPGRCITAVPRFPVPKGDDDIRVVWDLAKNGMNETVYTPTFFLASMSTYLRRVHPGMFGGDFDIGEQFHNYRLHESEQLYCGVEIPLDLRVKLQQEGLRVDPYMRWCRLVFGWQSSPYMALRMFARTVELAKGKPDDPRSAFSWVRVEMNLPGDLHYNPGKPRVMKITSNGTIASDLVTFYDDGRVFGSNEEITQRALRQVTSRLQWYGNQDAARKRRAISQRPGAWAGGIVYTDQNLLRVFVDVKKWQKAKDFLQWVWESISTGDRKIERKAFRSGKGFLVHMSTCYDYIQPFLKGFHLSEDAWRENRDDEGWKVQRHQSSTSHSDDDKTGDLFADTIESDDIDMEQECCDNAPPYIEPAKRLYEDVRILREFFQPATPLQVIVRPVEGSTLVVYGGGDASGEGYGGQLNPMGLKPLVRRGFWVGGDAENSSNWRELRNLVETIREEAISGRLVGREIWMATDNSTASSAYHRGSSTSKILHEMVTELRLLTIKGNFILRLYHIAGTRMIASGIDGLSRGELDVESLTRSIQVLMPLNKTPIERSPLISDWLTNFLGTDYTIAQPTDWFYYAQQGGEYTTTDSATWVWDIAPAVAIHAIEELGMGRLKRHNVLRGVVVIPTLLEHEWFRRFTRVVDFYFTIPPGSIPAWPCDMYEPLTVGIYLPLFRHRPWDWKRVPFLVPFGRTLSAMYKSGDPNTGNLLRKFWNASTRITGMPKRLVLDVLQSDSWRKFLSLSSEG